ncbi:MAG: phage tail tape measure protein [Bacteroides sp.]
MSKNKDVRRGIVLYLDGKRVENNVKSIKAEVQRLTRELNKMTIGSKEYNDQMEKIRRLNGILREHRSELAGVEQQVQRNKLSIGSLVDGFNRFGGIVVAAIGALTGVTLALRSFREERNKLQESQAGLQALTGLDDASIQWLTRQAKQLSTTMTREGLRVRAAASEILDAYMLVGSAKPELLANKEALAAVTEEAMRLQAAAKDITLAQAVDSLTLSLNQYGAAAAEAARYANVLAAGSKAGAANIASQAKAIRTAGTAASSANVSIEQTVGLIETLAYKGIKDEVAGTGLKKFFLTLQTGARDTNPAIVGLDQALQNLQQKNLTAAQVKKLFGEEGYNVASVILQNLPLVRQYTEDVTGTSVAMEQAAINSDTAAAKLTQAKNKMKVAMTELGERLDGVYTVSTNLATYLVKILPTLIDWFREWGGTVLWLGTVVVGFTTYTRLAAAATSAYTAVLTACRAVTLAYGAAVSIVKGYTITHITQMRQLLTLMGRHRIALQTLRAATYLYSATVNVLHGRIDMASKSMRGFFAVLTSHPFGLLAAAVVAAVTAGYHLTQRTKEYYDLRKVGEKISRRAQEDTAAENERMGRLVTTLRDNTRSLGERRRALDQLREIVPDYHAELTDEGRLINDNTEALDRYNQAIEVNAELKSVTAELDRHRINLLQLEERQRKLQNEKSLMGSMTRMDVADKLKQEQQIVDELTQRYRDLVAQKYKIDHPTASQATSTNLKKQPATSGETEEERKKRVNRKLERIETEHMQQQTHLQRLYLEGQIESAEEYDALLLSLEQQTLDKKLAVAGLEPHRREELQVKMLEALKKFKEDCQRQEEQAARKKEHLDKKESQRAVDVHTRRYQEQSYLLAKQHYQQNSSEEEYRRQQADLQQSYYNQLLADTAVSEEKKNEIRQKLREADLQHLEETSRREVEQQKQTFQALSSFAQEFGTELSGFLTDTETSVGDFLKNILKMMLDALEKMVVMAVTERTVKNIATLGLAGIAKAAAEIALITAAFETAKAAVGNFYTGGYTPSGRWDEPQGVVHSNEFVANRFAVANPAVRPVLDLIDQAQRRGTISHLTADDIAAVAPGRSADRSRPVVITPSQPERPATDPEVKAVIRQLQATVSRLNSRLDEPFLTQNVISGRGGLYKKLEEYQQLLHNKSRQP